MAGKESAKTSLSTSALRYRADIAAFRRHDCPLGGRGETVLPQAVAHGDIGIKQGAIGNQKWENKGKFRNKFTDKKKCITVAKFRKCRESSQGAGGPQSIS